MRVAVLCAVLSFITLAYGQVPPRCAVPPVWSGQIFERDRAQGYVVAADYFYDAADQRTATVGVIDRDQGRQKFYDIDIYFPGGSTHYEINLDTEECVITNDTAKFPYMQIPANATFLGELYLGTSSIEGAGVLAELWTGITTNPNGRYDIMVTAKGCIPLNDFFIDFDQPQIVEVFYANIVDGIPDPEVFIPPPQCR